MVYVDAVHGSGGWCAVKTQGGGEAESATDAACYKQAILFLSPGHASIFFLEKKGYAINYMSFVSRGKKIKSQEISSSQEVVYALYMWSLHLHHMNP